MHILQKFVTIYKDKNNGWLHQLLIVFIAFGIIASAINLLNDRSLWLDEIMLATSIVNRSFIELLQPLEMDQVAPIGFLFVEEFFTTLFNNKDWSFRLFPFFSFLLSIILIYTLSKQLFKSTTIALLSCALFSLNLNILLYAIEVKQYIVDVFISLLVVVSALHFQKHQHNKSLILFTVVSILSVWFSNIAVIMLFTVGLYILFKMYFKNPERDYKGFIPIIFSAISFFIYYAIFIHEHPAREHMLEYWTDMRGFLYKDLFSYNFNYFIYSRTRTILEWLIAIDSYFWFITLGFIIIGVLANLKLRKALFITLLPIGIHLTLSYFKLYPFQTRLALYLFPFLIILLSAGLWVTYLFFKRFSIKISVFILLIPLLCNAIAVAKNTPKEHEEIKKSMQYINTNIDRSDAILVYSSSKIHFNYYKSKFPNIINNQFIHYGIEFDYDNNTLKHLEVFNNLTEKIWIVFSHTKKEEKVGYNEEHLTINHIRHLGFKLLSKKKYTGSSVYEMTKINP